MRSEKSKIAADGIIVVTVEKGETA